MDEQRCPICKAPVAVNPRYPQYVCPACVRRAVDGGGRGVRFMNTTPLGMVSAHDVDTGQRVSEDVWFFLCFVDGVRCPAVEAHLGGVVVEPEKGE